VVKVADQYANPVSGVTVNFTVTSGGGTLSAPSAVTTANGQAQVNLTLGTAAGAVTVNASVAGVPAPAGFSVTATAGVAASLAIVSGNNQSGTAGSTLASPLVVKVTDQYGNAVAGIAATFAVTSGGGSLDVGTANTGADGRAQARWTLGSTGGSNAVRVTAGSLAPVEFQATVLVPTSLTVVSGNNQSGVAGTALADALVVKIADQYGNPLVGVAVSFAITAGSGTLSAPSALTNSSGQAQVTLTLGTTAGTVTVNATISGVATPATFTATATPGSPASLAIVSGNSQTAIGGSLLPNPLVTKLTDQYSNAVPGVTVLFTVASGAGSLSRLRS
jgi:hypothetical protein